MTLPNGRSTVSHIPDILMATVLERDITDTLTKLRRARHLGDRREEKACQDRLDRLLDRIERRP